MSNDPDVLCQIKKARADAARVRKLASCLSLDVDRASVLAHAADLENKAIALEKTPSAIPT